MLRANAPSRFGRFDPHRLRLIEGRVMVGRVFVRSGGVGFQPYAAVSVEAGDVLGCDSRLHDGGLVIGLASIMLSLLREVHG